MSINEQLSAYRARKAAQHGKEEVNNSFIRRTMSVIKNAVPGNNTREKVDEQPPVSPTEEGPPQTRELPSHSAKTPSDNYMSRFVKNDTFLITRPRFLKLLLWLILWGLFIELEFGSVFFIVSLFYIVYTSMASGTRNKEELSAYSVFNPNCERIDGTFTTEQFEKELRYGALAVH